MPDNMEHHGFVGRVFVVMVVLPVVWVEINLDITDNRCAASDLNDSLAKIRAGFMIPKSGMQDPQRLAIGGLQVFAMNSLTSPYLLKKAFVRSFRLCPII